jgi:type IV secretory pathway TraG/TraD family ATPase VirD4
MPIIFFIITFIVGGFIVCLVLIAFFPRLTDMKFFRYLLVFNAVRLWFSHRALRKNNEGRFLHDREVRELLAPNQSGLVLDGYRGRLSPDASFRNVAIVATTGAGKTSSYILPNLYSLDRATIVATDPSGALSEKTAGDLERRGYRVLILDPVHLSESIGYNPLDRANSFSAMQEVAHILFNNSDQNKGDPFWSQSAETIGGCLISCLKNHPEAKKYANLANLLYLLNQFGDGTPLMKFVATHAPNESIFLTFKAFISQADRTIQGVLSQAKAAIAWVNDPDIAQLTGKSTFDFESLRGQKTALFLRVPQNRVAYYAPLLSLFYTQLFHYLLDDDLYSKKSLDVYCLLDEFAHLSIPHFSSIITTTRARRVSLSLVLQSISQLEERYGKNGAHTILHGGCASQLYFSGMDLDTAQKLKEMLGDIPVDTLLPNGAFRRDRESLMSVAALRSMTDNEAIYLYGNRRPMKLKLTPYFEQKDLGRRSKIAEASSLPLQQ